MLLQARKEKQSTDSTVREQVEAVENELNESWSGKLERAVSAAESRWTKKYASLEVRGRGGGVRES